ncbi:GNAT family N-acetyltransferase [Metabacillus halosaccharovorans]|uniref:GNAT family N-acetyltransferase n=1 Tax=Metabacillus halosaccharovorans TaxID=930124 RepID=UPI00203CC42F|nr:GNAT family N-acetyltransferase [Metabacillus halosaccharovorans]MCM3439259.1 GNAT family N-acetyltransferase [Metabacillus halosaccharovorans]
MRYTDRSLRILKYAEMEAERTTKIVYPIHLLLGVLLERTSVCAELYINYPNLTEKLNKRVKEIQLDKGDEGFNYDPFTLNISQTTKRVLVHAENQMKRFKQVYLNEGHIVDAIFKVNDKLTRAIIDGLDVSRILEIVSLPRDMVVSLKDYSFPTFPKSGITFRKAKQKDASSLKTFVEKEFGNGWLDSIENGFLQEDIPIFIALDGQGIIGFACFDVVRSKKGLFGPMGTSYSNRIQGIGYTLLHYCLGEMKEIGYEYAVIGEAGPLEFYEKACNALVIPKKFTDHR